MADEEWLRTAMWILTLTKPCRDWYGVQRHTVRDRLSASKFNVDYTAGGILGPVCCMLDFAKHDLSQMLIVENLTDGNAAFKVKEDDPLVMSQDQMASKMWRMSLSTVFHWLLASSPRMWSFPSAFLGLLHHDKDCFPRLISWSRINS